MDIKEIENTLVIQYQNNRFKRFLLLTKFYLLQIFRWNLDNNFENIMNRIKT